MSQVTSGALYKDTDPKVAPWSARIACEGMILRKSDKSEVNMNGKGYNIFLLTSDGEIIGVARPQFIDVKNRKYINCWC